jgi:hypothetical protein
MNPERTDDARPASQPADRPSDAAPSAQKPVRMSAHIVEGSGRIIDVTITELFANGCIVEAPEDLQPDENVQLSILGSAAERACVAWSKDGLAELRFERDSAGSPRRPRRTQRLPLACEVSFRRASPGSVRSHGESSPRRRTIVKGRRSKEGGHYH